MNEAGYLLAFANGLLGALHCLGMCSGMAASCGVGGPRLLWPVLWYQGARILTYCALGVAGALAGQVLVQTGWVGKLQGVLMMGAGVLVSLNGLGLMGGFPRQGVPKWPLLPPLLGVLNGLAPCSLVFTVALAAVATQDPWRAAGLMLLFGLGTVPTMAAVSILALRGVRLCPGPWARVTGLAVLLLGLWTLWQGWVFFDVMRGLVD